MIWSEIAIQTTQEANEAIANILHEAGAGGVIIEDPEVLARDFASPFGEVYELSPEDFPEEGIIIKAYLPVNSYLLETIEQIKLLINELPIYGIEIGKGTITVSEVDEEDWATSWKKYYKPVQISERFWIKPSWEEIPENNQQLVIELDPGMAFGTGTHPTTILCIKALEEVIKGGEEVIDVGCGTGVLSIAAAKLGAKNVLALDLDSVAVESAGQNIAINSVDNRVRVRQNNLLEGIEQQVEVIVANILAEVILRFIDSAKGLLKEKGYFITSGIINTKADLVREALEEAGFRIVKKLDQEDWVAFIAKND